MPIRRSDSEALRRFAVAVASPVTKILLGTYSRPIGAVIPTSRYRNPANLACFLMESMCPPSCALAFEPVQAIGFAATHQSAHVGVRLEQPAHGEKRGGMVDRRVRFRRHGLVEESQRRGIG